MRITMITLGSRGDIQPYVPLGMGLQAAGYQVRVATHSEFESFVRAHGLDFAPLSGNPREMVQSEAGQQWLESRTNPIAFARGLKTLTRDLVGQVVEESARAAADADVIMSSVLGLFSAIPIAEKRRVRLVAVPLQPIQDTRYITNSTFPPVPDWLPFKGVYNRLSYSLSRRLLWLIFGGAINRLRAEMLGLPPTTASRAWFPDAGLPVLYGFSRHVVPHPPDWGPNTRVCGYWFLDEEAGWQPPPDLLDFLEAGPPPVYIGFGSMNNRDPEATLALVLEALRLSGQRAVLLSGWGGLSASDLPDDVYHVDSIPHAWLFPRVAAVVHHGGAGTTAAGLRAGAPSILTPFFADQYFWGERVRALGVGPKPIPRSHLTAPRLADALRQAASDGAMRARAAALGAQIRAEDGVATAVRTFEALAPVAVRPLE